MNRPLLRGQSAPVLVFSHPTRPRRRRAEGARLSPTLKAHMCVMADLEAANPRLAEVVAGVAVRYLEKERTWDSEGGAQ